MLLDNFLNPVVSVNFGEKEGFLVVLVLASRAKLDDGQGVRVYFAEILFL